jgi:hypothetical protein
MGEDGFWNGPMPDGDYEFRLTAGFLLAILPPIASKDEQEVFAHALSKRDVGSLDGCRGGHGLGGRPERRRTGNEQLETGESAQSAVHG